MKNAPLGATGEAVLKIDRSAVMTAAWASYRQTAATCGYMKFDRRLFGRVLRMAWINAKADDAKRRRAEAAALIVITSDEDESPLSLALEAVQYLPAHMSSVRAIAEIHARYA